MYAMWEKTFIENLRLSESPSSCIDAADVISIYAPHLLVNLFKPRPHLRLNRQTQAVQLFQQNLKQNNKILIERNNFRGAFEFGGSAKFGRIFMFLGHYSSNGFSLWLDKETPIGLHTSIHPMPMLHIVYPPYFRKKYKFPPITAKFLN